MVAYLTKYYASEGFNQVIDFLNGSYLKYALTVNPNIYVSCIKQLWNTVAIKQVNDVTRLQALVDKKKVVVTEAAIREVLRLDDAEGVDCLPNEEIFTELARIGYENPSIKLTFYKAFFLSQWKFLIHTILLSLSAKRTLWNEFSSAMASAVICLSTGHKIEEEKDADEHVEDVTASDDAQGDDTAAHGEVPTITQEPSIPSPTLTIPPSQPPQDIPSTSQVQQTPPQSPQVQPPSPQPQPQQQATDFPMNLLQEALDAYVALTKRVEHLEYDKVAQALEITKLKRRVKKLEKGNKARASKLRRLQTGRMIDEMDKDDAVILIDEKEEDKKVEEAMVDEIAAASAIISAAEPQVPAATIIAAPAKVVAAPSRRRKGVVIRDPEEESTTSSIISTETKSKDKGKGIMVEEPKPLKKKQQIEIDEEYARKLHAEINKDIDWDVAVDHVMLKPKEDPATKEKINEGENRALQSINETLAQKAAKRRKLNEEVKDLKIHLEIVPDEDDDVYTEATPLARKVSVVDYEIIELNNKPYYKIIRADRTHQLYISFLTLLKTFDR
nr:hypothetical protein [Tanacetum cinerariifolium]